MEFGLGVPVSDAKKLADITLSLKDESDATVLVKHFPQKGFTSGTFISD